MGLPQRKEEIYTFGDYLAWKDNKRWEVIDGIACNLATPLRIHQEILGKLFTKFSNYLEGKQCKVYMAPFNVRFPKENEKNEDITNFVEPDITVVCDKNKLDKYGCLGTPDLIVEILSESTAKNDLIKKLNLYESSGVKEYWIADPLHKTIQILTLGKNNKYNLHGFYSSDDKIKPHIFPELEIDLSKVFEE